MKLISLNIWGGRVGREKLLSFFDQHKEADIFCLQEVWAAPYEHLEGKNAGGVKLTNAEIMVRAMQEISDVLPNHASYFKPHFLEHYGLLILIKKELEVLEEGDIFVHLERGYMPPGDVGLHARNVQYITFNTPEGKRTVLNFHGLWNGQGKGDSKDRLLQSDRIAEFIKTLQNPFVLCGDFNLLPTTESLQKLENAGLRNLITEYTITSTRTSYYTKQEKFADYTLVSDGIEVQDFRVLPDEVSDHAAMYLEFI